MYIVLVLIIVGFAAGYFIELPFFLLDVKYLALLFMAFLDSFTCGLTLDLSKARSTNRIVFTRLLVALIFGGFIIYFGEKSQMDLYLLALLPLAFGTALNLYKFLPK